MLRWSRAGCERPVQCAAATIPDVRSDDLLSLFLVQDVAHIDGGYRPRVGLNVPSDGLSLAGFQVIMYGRFWVITEERISILETLNGGGCLDRTSRQAPRDACRSRPSSSSGAARTSLRVFSASPPTNELDDPRKLKRKVLANH
jgi:hypothetical protein